jgi:Transglycosylase SLT domain
LRPQRLALAGAAVVLAIAVLAAVLSGGGPPPLPLPGIGRPARGGDPFAYIPGRQADFTARAISGNGQVLFVKSPGGALSTAARVAALRGEIDAAAAGTGVDPNTLEGIVFLESAGQQNAIAGSDPANAAGLTQILAETGQSLLGMNIDLVRSRQLTAQIDRAYGLGESARVAQLQRARAKIDDRFNPAKAVAATVRYLQLAQRRFGRADLAIVSYHMGIGNLQNVLADYGAGQPVPYVQLYFDTAPNNHGAAYRLLSGFGDDSWTYYWRVLAAEQIMRLYRSDPSALRRLSSLQTASGSDAEVLHPPEETPTFADPNALDAGYANRSILPLPSNAKALGLAYDPGIGSLAHRLGVSPALYRGLRAPALDLLVELAARVRTLSGGAAPLTVTSAISDNRYQQLLGINDPPAAAGWSFTIARHYVSGAQALAFQAMLDRLQALNVIAWQRYPSEIEVTVSAGASHVIVDGP